MRLPLTPAPVRVVAARAVVVLGFAAAFAIASRPEVVQRAGRGSPPVLRARPSAGTSVDAPRARPTRPSGRAGLGSRRGAARAP